MWCKQRIKWYLKISKVLILLFHLFVLILFVRSAVQWFTRQLTFPCFAKSWGTMCICDIFPGHVWKIQFGLYLSSIECFLWISWNTLGNMRHPGVLQIWAGKHWPREWLLNSDSCWVNGLSHLTFLNLIFLICKTKLSVLTHFMVQFGSIRKFGE